MADVDDSRRATNGRQAASNLRELLNKIDIKAGADRFDPDEAEVSTILESERSQSPQASLRDVFAKARTGISRASISSLSTTPGSRLPRPRRSSIDSDISSAPTAMYTPGRAGGDDEPMERTPVARAPPLPLSQTPSAAASFHALRARLENASDTHTDAGSDLTGWDRSARSLLTTRGQASSSKLNMYLDDNEDTNLLDEDLGGVPALTVSHVDDSNMRFAPSVGNSSRTPTAPRSRPGAIPKGPSLQSASIAERLADIPDDGLEFDDTDREDFDRNRMEDDNEDLLHNENDLLRTASPPPDQFDSPRRPPAFRSLAETTARTARPISGSWENVMGESLLSLPNPPESPERPLPARTSKPMTSANNLSNSGSSSGDASRLMQTIQSEEESFQRSRQEKSRQTSTEKSQDTSTPDRSDATTTTTPARTSRLSMFGRSRLPLAKPSPKPDASSSTTKPGTSEISFPRAPSPTSPEKHLAANTTPQSQPPVSPPRALSPQTSASDSPSRRLSAPGSPVRSISRTGPIPPVTPSRIPRVSMHASHPSWDRMDDMAKSPSPGPPKTPARSQSSLGHHTRVTPSRSASSLSHRGTPPETDVDRERAWGKTLPKLTHANLRMRHESMESSLGGSVYGGALSPGRPGSVIGMSPGRPATPSNRSFVGYSVRAGSEVSSSQGSAGSDEEAEARRAREMSSPSGVKSGAELRGHRSSLTSPTAASLARSAGMSRSTGGLTRHSSLKSPGSGKMSVGAPMMRHSASFAGAGSSVSGLSASDQASPVGSPGSRKLVGRRSVEYNKEAEHLRERDWGRPLHSRAPGIGSISPRPPRVVAGGRARVVSGGSVGSVERPESPIPRMRTGSPVLRVRARAGSGVKPRPHTIHFGSLEETREGVSERGPLAGGEELLEREDEGVEESEDRGYFGVQEPRRDSPPSPPSPSRSIPLPPSPPAVHVTAPAEASVSLFKLKPEDEEPAAESTRRIIPAEPDSPVKRRLPTQPESPTISFMDTLPPLPEPPSEDEIEPPVLAAPVPVTRPSVNTRLSPHYRATREPSPASGSGGSGSEQTPRVSSLILPVPGPGQSRTPSPPTARPENQGRGLDLAGVEPSLIIPKITRTRSNTLGAAPRVDVNLSVPRDEIDSAATPIASQWMERNRLRAAAAAAAVDRNEGSTSRDDKLAPKSETLLTPSPLDLRSPNPPAPAPMVSQRGKDIIQRMQHSTAALARDLEVESSRPVPQADVVQVETEQIVKLSTAARAERERLERLRLARKDEVEKTAVLPARKRWSIPWILLTMILTALCAWLALYAISQRASNVYLDPLYPILYGDVNPLRPARTIDTFPTSWQAHMVPPQGIQQYLPISTLSQNWQKLWAAPNWTIQHLLLNWPPS
ncbi:hypothetical protein FRC12_024495 [Ceratobasidium sp. 428]|nr:hypothetical protein FRC12_024495 [Ceratobasidium sp. 428]